MKIEVLPDRQFGVERERLRHVADPIARTHVACFERFPEQQRLAFARRQQAGQHFHRRRLAAAVRAEEAENLAALDGEAHPVDRREVAEAAGEIARDDDGLARRRCDAAVSAAVGDRRAPRSGSSAMNASSSVAAPALGLEFGRGSGRQAPCRRSWPPASRTAPLLPYRPSRPARSCPGGASASGRSAPRIGGARADRRRWSARQGSGDPDRG